MWELKLNRISSSRIMFGGDASPISYVKINKKKKVGGSDGYKGR